MEEAIIHVQRWLHIIINSWLIIVFHVIFMRISAVPLSVRFTFFFFFMLSCVPYPTVKPLPHLPPFINSKTSRGAWSLQVPRTAKAGRWVKGRENLTLPAPVLSFQEDITVSWIINENKLATIKYWKGYVYMLTIKMASEALTCLKERACKPNASQPPPPPPTPSYLEFHNPVGKHCAHQ